MGRFTLAPQTETSAPAAQTPRFKFASGPVSGPTLSPTGAPQQNQQVPQIPSLFNQILGKTIGVGGTLQSFIPGAASPGLSGSLSFLDLLRRFTDPNASTASKALGAAGNITSLASSGLSTSLGQQLTGDAGTKLSSALGPLGSALGLGGSALALAEGDKPGGVSGLIGGVVPLAANLIEGASLPSGLSVAGAHALDAAAGVADLGGLSVTAPDFAASAIPGLADFGGEFLGPVTDFGLGEFAGPAAEAALEGVGLLGAEGGASIAGTSLLSGVGTLAAPLALIALNAFQDRNHQGLEPITSIGHLLFGGPKSLQQRQAEEKVRQAHDTRGVLTGLSDVLRPNTGLDLPGIDVGDPATTDTDALKASLDRANQVLWQPETASAGDWGSKGQANSAKNAMEYALYNKMLEAQDELLKRGSSSLPIIYGPDYRRSLTPPPPVWNSSLGQYEYWNTDPNTQTSGPFDPQARLFGGTDRDWTLAQMASRAPTTSGQPINAESALLWLLDRLGSTRESVGQESDLLSALVAANPTAPSGTWEKLKAYQPVAQESLPPWFNLSRVMNAPQYRPPEAVDPSTLIGGA